jgi:hypothetical protein
MVVNCLAETPTVSILNDPYPVGSMVMCNATLAQVVATRVRSVDGTTVHDAQLSFDGDATLYWKNVASISHDVTAPLEANLMALLETRNAAQEVADILISSDKDATLDDVRAMVTSELHCDDTIVACDTLLALDGNEVLNTWTMFTVGSSGTLMSIASSQTIDTSNARHWHTPSNEREFNRSPERALWQTAKELKWSEYLALNMFNWVKVSDIDTRVYKIYNTLWAYKIKLNSDSTFNKLNPRWCVKGGTMDRSVYKSFAETMRMTSFKIILAIKAGYFMMVCDFLIDCSNAFQTTRTDVVQEGEKALPKFYCWPAPTFERRTETGERMACEVLVGMQGRIDATRLFNSRLMAILRRANCYNLLWDRQLVVYHDSSLARTDASLVCLTSSVRSKVPRTPSRSSHQLAMPCLGGMLTMALALHAMLLGISTATPIVSSRTCVVSLP